MKRLLVAFAATALLLACNSEKKTDESSAGSGEKKESSPVSYAYKAGYSSDFSMGDPNHSKMVLDLYKMWEDNKLDEMKTILADSVSVVLPDGTRIPDQPVDSFITVAKQFRKNYSSIKLSLDGWMAVKSNDKKEDFVLTWLNDYATDQSGKTDSVRIHTYFLIKNNKIRHWSEFEQKMVPPPQEKK